MSETPPMVRQWALLKSLSARRNGATVRELADEHGVNQKTIRRDLIALQRVGFPLEPTQSEHGRNHWRLVEPNHCPPLSFNPTEVIALYLGRRFLEPLAGTYFWEAANSAFKKIRAGWSETLLQYAAKLGATFHQTSPGLTDYSQKAEIVDRLMIAIEDCKTSWICGQFRRQELDCRFALQPRVLGQKHFPYATCTDLGGDAIVADCLADHLFSCARNGMVENQSCRLGVASLI